MSCRIALASCAPFPPVPDDEAPLVAALEALGAEVTQPAWDAADVDWADLDAVVLRTPWDYQERPDAFMRWCERVDGATTLLHGAAIVRWNIDKRYLAALDEAGCELAPTAWIAPGDTLDVAREVRARGWTRAFLKPIVGANASDTLRFEATPRALAAAQAHADALAAGSGGMLQPYLATVETAGELSAIFLAGSYSHGVRKVPVAGDYRVQDDHGASDVPYVFTGDELTAAMRVVAAAEMLLATRLLYARVDFLRDPVDGRLLLNELELIEPSLFWRHAPSEAAPHFARAILAAAR